MLVGRAVDGDDANAVLREPRREGVDPLAEDGGEATATRERRRLLAGLKADERRLGELPVQVLGDDEDVSHAQITFASSCSTWTSSCTEPTFRPPVRLGGVSSFTMRVRGATSTPSSASGISLSSFLRAFMIPGSEA